MDLTKFNNRIQVIREHHNLSKAELARRLKISKAYVTELEAGQRTSISTRLAKVISYELGVNGEWLLEGKGEPFLSSDAVHSISQNAAAEQEPIQSGDLSAFERLLSEISATYINLPMEQLETVLKDDFSRLGRQLAVDACIMYLRTEDSRAYEAVFWFVDESQECNKPLAAWLESKPTISDKNMKYIFEKWDSDEATLWARLEDIPDDATMEKTATINHNIKSALGVPIRFSGVTRGVLNIATTSAYRTFSHDLIPRLRLFGEVFINALMRKQSEEKLRNVLSFDSLLSEISAKYINLPSSKMEIVMMDDFKRLTEAIGADACILYMRSEELGAFKIVRPFVWFFDTDQDYNKTLIKWLGKATTINSENLQYLFHKWNRDEPVSWARADDLPKEAESVKQTTSYLGVKSSLSVPIRFAGSVRAVLNVITTASCRSWPEDLIPRICLFGEVFINALMRKQSEEKLQQAFAEIKQLKERFEADYTYLREETDRSDDFSGIVGKSDVLKKILIKVRQVAPTNSTVLILGETGTGKGLIAREIHNASSFKDRPLVQVNCATLTPSLVESELFGHEKGAFTGAASRRMGRFEAAQGTTLFLDEIGDLPLELQPKLLRVLEEGEFERVGGSATIHTDVRLIAATNRDLEKEVKAGRFRRDLLYRLNIFPIFVPPLRERLDDVPLFVAYFVERYARWAGKKFDAIPVETVRSLQGYSWPGNIRELKNVIERAVIMSPTGNLQIEIPKHPDRDHAPEPMKALRDIERESIIRVLEQTHWKINGQGGAAHYLDIHPATLRSRMKKLNIKRSAQAYHAE